MDGQDIPIQKGDKDLIKIIPNNSKRKWIFETQDHVRNSVEVCIKPQLWQDMDSCIVLPFSIESALYEGISGHLKIKAFLNTIKSYAKNKILILLCEGAHLNALSITHHSVINSLNIFRNKANQLLARFKDDFDGFEIAFWEDFVWQHKMYASFNSEISNFSNSRTPPNSP